MEKKKRYRISNTSETISNDVMCVTGILEKQKRTEKKYFKE